MLFRKQKPVVGLDIGSSAIKAVELKASGKGWKVVAFGVEPLPPDTIVDGAIIDGTAVADAIRRLFDRLGIKNKEVAASLSGNAVIVKKITLPAMTDAELSTSITWEAEQYIPFDIQDVNLDYQVLSRPPKAAAGATMDVLLVAAKKETIADYTGVIAQAGKLPAIVDVDAFALQNAYEANYGTRDAIVALLNIGASAININIVRGDQSLFTRDVPIGGNAYTEALQKDFQIAQESADLLKRGYPADGLDPTQTGPSLQMVTEAVLLEVQKTLDFFRGTTGADHIDLLMVTGGASQVAGLVEALQERLGYPVELLDPFKTVSFDAAKFGVPVLSEAAAAATVAVGLALRRKGDR
ncbi:pilus assembly protein PilM [Luteitalea sp. TBR-22]|uniref:type IV pilus biogenesis protein PilM n=1 Tax=Luteitalea sp. TBR-22 TaxID=2802971 RepID=UPI001AF1A2E7|nr:type IV pilus assembly protein PilM [Luteitalea sp. TBR-22]BCS33860.1 pilus assembly protein PilM [Luteitalea sp. TBR-22]